VIVPYFTKEWFVDMHKEKKTLVVVSGGAHVASEAIALVKIAKSGADVLYVLQLLQPFDSCHRLREVCPGVGRRCCRGGTRV
jgi:hypothetical protein